MSAPMAEATAMAVRSDPPRPRVVISPSSVSPWKPAMMTISSRSRCLRIWSGVMLLILALVWMPLVTMPACAPVSETALPPIAWIAMAARAIVVCSPVERRTSISRSVGFGETSLASLIKESVTPDIAETMATTEFPSRCVSSRRLATLRILSGLPTEVPPYFWTIRAMG